MFQISFLISHMSIEFYKLSQHNIACICDLARRKMYIILCTIARVVFFQTTGKVQSLVNGKLGATFTLQ